MKVLDESGVRLLWSLMCSYVLNHVVQANWQETDPTNAAYIRNRPFGPQANGTIAKVPASYLPDMPIAAGSGSGSAVMDGCSAPGDQATALGEGTQATDGMLAFGRYNLPGDGLCESVGNGDDGERLNIRTLSWDGYEMLAGSVWVQDGIYLTGDDGEIYRLSVDTGALVIDPVTEETASLLFGQPEPEE